MDDDEPTLGRHVELARILLLACEESARVLACLRAGTPDQCEASTFERTRDRCRCEVPYFATTEDLAYVIDVVGRSLSPAEWRAAGYRRIKIPKVTRGANDVPARTSRVA